MRRTNNNRATIPSLNRITDHPRHYHSHINADQQISINMVYDVNRQLPTNAVPQLNNNIQNILSTPPLFDSVKCQTRLISSYTIEKQIGQGGYGKVYECTRISSRNKKGAKPYMRAKKVAIKVISIEKIVRKDMIPID